MKDSRVRQAIAAEAARLLSQRKEADYHSARRKAARWYSRERVSPDDLPSFQEIQQQLFALTGLFAAERQATSLKEIRLATRELLVTLGDFGPRAMGTVVTGPVLPGAEIEIGLSTGAMSQVAAVLLDAGHQATRRGESGLAFFHHFDCIVWCPTGSESSLIRNDTLAIDDLDRLVANERSETPFVSDLDDPLTETDQDDQIEGYHPDFFPTLEVLLSGMEKIRLDPDSHPEGDLLYHTLQVYELVLAEHPYDEELLLAALTHDIGTGLDRRRPLEATWNAIGGMITRRTWFFIENRAEAQEYLRTGRIRGALKKHEDFEELVFFAQCDLKGRQRGVAVSSLETALEYVEGLGSAWDDA